MIEKDQIRTEFSQILEQRPDIGVRRIITGWFVEPPNAFDPQARRSPKRGIVIVSTYLILMAGAWAFFNFR
jgi:hypothetical protein